MIAKILFENKSNKITIFKLSVMYICDFWLILIIAAKYDAEGCRQIRKGRDVVQSKLEAAGHYLESEWNKHNFGPVLVVAHFYNSINCLFVIGAGV